MVAVVVEAVDASVAATAVTSLMTYAPTEIDALAGWTITTTEIREIGASDRVVGQ